MTKAVNKWKTGCEENQEMKQSEVDKASDGVTEDV